MSEYRFSFDKVILLQEAESLARQLDEALAEVKHLNDKLEHIRKEIATTSGGFFDTIINIEKILVE